MITLGTGLPGNGKTLFMLWYLKRKADKENRPVFYHNVKDLNLDVLGNWKTFDPEKWYELPSGAIVLIDECQDIFPKKPNGAALPEHFTKLNTHRHLGIDLFLITQHPSLIDNSVRRLVGQHFHSIRKFGLQRSTIYEWSGAVASPELASSHKNAVTMKWKFPKEVFTWYKSAEIHTVKRSIPIKLILALLFIVGALVFGGYIFSTFDDRIKTGAEEVPKAAPATSVFPVASVGSSSASSTAASAASPSPGYLAPEEDAKQYLWGHTPRLEGLPETAPRYDALTAPTRVPVPAMCIQIGDVRSEKPIRCQCYTQQATKLDVEFNMCMDIARNGRFMDFDPDPNRRRDNTAVQLADASHADRSARLLSVRSPDVAMGPNYGASPVSSFTEAPSRIEGARPAPNLNDGPPPGRTTRTEVVNEAGSGR